MDVNQESCKGIPGSLTYCLSQMTFDYDFAKMAFDACGYDFTYVDKDKIRNNKKPIYQQIVSYIHKGIPVISKGC